MKLTKLKEFCYNNPLKTTVWFYLLSITLVLAGISILNHFLTLKDYDSYLLVLLSGVVACCSCNLSIISELQYL